MSDDEALSEAGSIAASGFDDLPSLGQLQIRQRTHSTELKQACTKIAQVDNAGDDEDDRVPFDLMRSNRDKKVIDTIRSGMIKSKQLTKSLVTFRWRGMPRTVLLVKKPNDACCTEELIRIAGFFSEQGLEVVVEPAVFEENLTAFDGLNVSKETPEKIVRVDFSVCLGGDGTILWCVSKFPRACPPILSVAMGSLGFLTTFSMQASKHALEQLLTSEMKITMRSRIQVRILNQDGTAKIGGTRNVLNEVVFKGIESMINLELYVGELKDAITNVQGDGLIVATPTGSTAYSMSAGGSMIHPSIPCILITPVCPHSLSFRPVVVSDTTVIRLRVPESARSDVSINFDGKVAKDQTDGSSICLRKGEEAIIQMSQYPVPCICSQGESADWFNAIKENFNWNERSIQKSFQAPDPPSIHLKPLSNDDHDDGASI